MRTAMGCVMALVFTSGCATRGEIDKLRTEIDSLSRHTEILLRSMSDQNAYLHESVDRSVNGFARAYRNADYVVRLVVDYDVDDVGGCESGVPAKRRVSSQLSGMVVEYNKKHYIVTAAHFITPRSPLESLAGISVLFKHKSLLMEPAELIGYDPTIDTALLAFTRHDFTWDGVLPQFSMGDPPPVAIGDQVMVIGSQLYGGVNFPWSAGIGNVMHLATDVPADAPAHDRVITHSAQGYIGSSGGPLINRRGKVIGMNINLRGGFSHATLRSEPFVYGALPIQIVLDALPRLAAGYRPKKEE